MSEYEHTEHLLIQIEYLRTANRQLREYAEDAVAKIKRLEEAIQERDKEWFQVIESILGFHPVSMTEALHIGIDRIKKQKQRIKRLEEAGDRMELYAAPHDSDKWNEAKESKP